jgi:Tol biopolymer transport system component
LRDHLGYQALRIKPKAENDMEARRQAKLGKGIGLILTVFALAVGSCRQGASSRVETPAQAKNELASLKPEFLFRGKIVFQSDMDGDNEIYLMTRDGVAKLTDNAWNDEYPRWSPDGSRIAFAANPKGNYDIFFMNADGSGITPIVNSPADEVEPAWFPDGNAIAYTIEKKGLLSGEAVLMRADLRTGVRDRLIPGFERTHGISDISPTAPLVAFTGKRLLGWDVFLHDLNKGESIALTDGGQSCRPRFSKDGTKIAYVSSRADGKGDIWTMNPDGSDNVRLTERDATSDYFPSWSPDGKYIVFCTSTEHSPKRGIWTLFVVKTATKTVAPLLKGPERALFPDWD